MFETIKQQFRCLPVTMSLLGMMGLVFLVMQVRYPFNATSGEAVLEMGGLLGAYMKLDASQWWRVLSSLFLHIGWEHVLLNGFMLYILGSQMEPIMGKWKFLLLYLLSGFMGNAFAIVLTPTTLVAGASGALYGLSAMFAVLYYKARNPSIRQIGQMQVGILLAGAVMSLLTPNVSLAGHLGGAVGGALCAFFLPIKGEARLFAPWQRFLALAGYVGLVLFAIFY